MINTVLCYIEHDGHWLMMNRNKKKNDLNEGKWVAVGGKFEEKESPIDCAIRETLEETGLQLKSPTLRGVVTFASNKYETEQMFIFHSTDFSGEVNYNCNEGTLCWQPISNIEKLPVWEGDKLFHDLLIAGAPFFSVKLEYEDDRLANAVVNGERIEL